MTLSESRIEFDFPDRYTVIKFDDTDLYRQSAASVGIKAVDFVAADAHQLLLLEVKNCLENKADNRWRIAANNKKRDTAATHYDVSDRDSLDIEMAQKAAGTLAVLAGSLTFSPQHRQSSACQDVAKRLCTAGEQKVLLILLLEYDFKGYTRKKSMIYKCLTDSIRKKTKWMNCTPIVVNAEMFSKKPLGITARVLKGGTGT